MPSSCALCSGRLFCVAEAVRGGDQRLCKFPYRVVTGEEDDAASLQRSQTCFGAPRYAITADSAA